MGGGKKDFRVKIWLLIAKGGELSNGSVSDFNG